MTRQILLLQSSAMCVRCFYVHCIDMYVRVTGFRPENTMFKEDRDIDLLMHIVHCVYIVYTLHIVFKLSFYRMILEKYKLRYSGDATFIKSRIPEALKDGVMWSK